VYYWIISWHVLILLHCNIFNTSCIVTFRIIFSLSLGVFPPNFNNNGVVQNYLRYRSNKYKSYSLWFDQIWAWTHDLPHSRRARLTITPPIRFLTKESQCFYKFILDIELTTIIYPTLTTKWGSYNNKPKNHIILNDYQYMIETIIIFIFPKIGSVYIKCLYVSFLPSDKFKWSLIL
jgi:hypothetical protein